MRILVLGAGATGGFFGGLLAATGADVTFLVRPQRAQLLTRDGLKIESVLGNVSRPVPVVTADEVGPDYDAIILSCKAYDLASAIDAIRPAVGHQTRIVPLLNGMRHLDVLDQTFGAERVLGGTCHISVTLAADGTILHLSPAFHALTQGPRQPAQCQFSEALHAEMSKAKFDARHSDQIIQTMWDKWVLLATLASMSCLMRASMGEISSTDHGARLISDTLDECCAVAARSGFAPATEVVEPIRALLTGRGSTLKASMLRDLESGARIEADHIVGDLIGRADRHSVAVPNLKIAYTALQVYQRRGAGNAASAPDPLAIPSRIYR